MFNRKKTKWMLLGNYSFGTVDYVVFFRGDLKSGLMDFKTRRVHDWKKYANKILPHNLIDVQKQWTEMVNIMNSK